MPQCSFVTAIEEVWHVVLRCLDGLFAWWDPHNFACDFFMVECCGVGLKRILRNA
jgi:hypothetical protein